MAILSSHLHLQFAFCLALGIAGCGSSSDTNGATLRDTHDSGAASSAGTANSVVPDAAFPRGSDAASPALDAYGTEGDGSPEPEVMLTLDNVDALSNGPLWFTFSRVGVVLWEHTRANAMLEAGVGLAQEVASKGKAWHVTDLPGQASDLHWSIEGFPPNVQAVPNLAAYAGVSFELRSSEGMSALTVAFTDSAVKRNRPHYFVQDSERGMPWFSTEVVATPEWSRVIVLFDDFRSADNRLFDASDFANMHVISGIDGTGGDYWLDNIALVCRGECPQAKEPKQQSPTGVAPAITDDSLAWLKEGAVATPAECGQVALLNDFPVPGVSGQAAKLVARARLLEDGSAPTWVWTVAVETGEVVNVYPLAQDRSTINFSVIPGARYTVKASTAPGLHAPCEVVFDAPED